MKEIIDRATLAALRHYGDAASAEFFRRLRERRLSTTRCDGCGHVAWPPRPFCPACHAEAARWLDLPTRGTLHAFTWQERSLRFSRPDVLGLVSLAGLLVLTRIDAPFETLAIGQEVELDFVEVAPELVLHQFRPVRSVGSVAVPEPPK